VAGFGASGALPSGSTQRLDCAGNIPCPPAGMQW